MASPQVHFLRIDYIHFLAKTITFRLATDCIQLYSIQHLKSKILILFLFEQQTQSIGAPNLLPIGETFGFVAFSNKNTFP